MGTEIPYEFSIQSSTQILIETAEVLMKISYRKFPFKCTLAKIMCTK